MEITYVQTTQSNLNSIPVVNGQVIYTSDTGNQYSDISSSRKRNVFGDEVESVKDMISDAYDSTHTYNVGDYCIYEDTLYRCNTAITTPEAFTPAKWDAITAVKEIKAALSMVVDEYNEGNFTANDYCKYQNKLYRCISPTSGAWDSSKWTEVTTMSEVERLTIGTTTQLRSGFHLQKQGNTKMLFFNGVARVGTIDTAFDDISQTGENPQDYPIFGAGILVMDNNNNFPCTLVLNTNGKIEVYYKDGTGEYKAPVNKLVYGILTWII